MPSFQYRNYATFTGPLSDDETAYSYDLDSREGTWPTDLAIDTSFKLTDIGALFYRDKFDYAYFHLYGTSTSLITLEKNIGDLPQFNANIKNSVFNGSVWANGNVIVNGRVVANESIIANQSVTINGVVQTASTITGPTIDQLNAGIELAKTLPAKSFDIKHPLKPDTHRLRYVSLEGPEFGVYLRGKLKDNNKIILPEHWKGLVHDDSITVNLTPIGKFQQLYVEEIINGKEIIIASNSDDIINCHYVVYGERKDMEQLIVEYEGSSAKDYPGQDYLSLK
jgi:hypothetical protein